jgi:hypothetical protein
MPAPVLAFAGGGRRAVGGFHPNPVRQVRGKAAPENQTKNQRMTTDSKVCPECGGLGWKLLPEGCSLPWGSTKIQCDRCFGTRVFQNPPIQKNMKTDPNVSAFPHDSTFAPGLTKRELFAALAIVGLQASPFVIRDVEAAAVNSADKLIEELNKNEE